MQRISRSRCHKRRDTGSDHARIFKICHVILNKQTPRYIAVSFACDWLFRNRLVSVSRKFWSKNRGGRFERPRPLMLCHVHYQIRAAEQDSRFAWQPILPEMTSYRKRPRIFKTRSVTWFWTHRWPSISRSHSRVIFAPMRKFWSKNRTDYMTCRWTRLSGLVARQPILLGNYTGSDHARIFKICHAEQETAIYLGLSVRLIVSEKSACLCLQCENSKQKSPPSSLSDHAHLFNFVTWLYANSAAEQEYRGRLPGNQYYRKRRPEATTPEFLKFVTWFWTSRHRWPSISRSHSRVTDSFREIGLSLAPVRKFDWSKNHPRKTGSTSLSDHAHLC